jgi:16S rRNA (guanine966-N2)-methyltransferase
MKIIAGERKGHTLTTPDGLKTRPTLSRVRESLFNIIAGDLPGAIFCELFAGSGSIGLEALSRGADKAIFVEIAREAFQCLRQNVQRLRYADRATLTQSDALRWQPPTGADAPDIIFADPPYDAAVIEKLCMKLDDWPLKSDALVILQTPAGYQPHTKLRHLRTATYGATALHFYLVDSGAHGTDTDQPLTGSR